MINKIFCPILALFLEKDRTNQNPINHIDENNTKKHIGQSPFLLGNSAINITSGISDYKQPLSFGSKG
jgi:hypothetical protein